MSAVCFDNIDVSLRRVLHDAVEVLKDIEVDGLVEVELKELLGLTRQVQAGVEALIWKVGIEADRLAAQGCSAPAEELLFSDGRVRALTAKKDAARARTMNEVAGLREAASDGVVSSDHVDSIGRRFKNLTDGERGKIDKQRLVERAGLMPADRFDRLVKNTVDQAREDHGLKDAIQKREASEFRHWFDHKAGMGKFSGQLDPERYEVLSTAIDHHTTTLAAASKGSTSSKNSSVAKDSNLAAAALVELVSNSTKRSQNVPHITVVVDHKTLDGRPHGQSIRQTGNGHPVPPETIDRLACDAVLQRVTLDKRGVPINVGRKHRTATSAQWTAIRSVYSGCAWSGCDRPLSWCQLHHIKEWRDGGKTDLDNLVPLCNTHHHRVHEGRWVIKLNPNRTLQIHKPNRELHQTLDPPTRQPGCEHGQLTQVKLE